MHSENNYCVPTIHGLFEEQTPCFTRSTILANFYPPKRYDVYVYIILGATSVALLTDNVLDYLIENLVSTQEAIQPAKISSNLNIACIPFLYSP